MYKNFSKGSISTDFGAPYVRTWSKKGNKFVVETSKDCEFKEIAT